MNNKKFLFFEGLRQTVGYEHKLQISNCPAWLSGMIEFMTFEKTFLTHECKGYSIMRKVVLFYVV